MLTVVEVTPEPITIETGYTIAWQLYVQHYTNQRAKGQSKIQHVE